MATPSLRSKFEEHLTCSLCLEQLKDPKVLPCLHSFCHDCIVKLITHGNSKNIACPECRKVVEIGDPDNLADLPSNFFVNNLLATMALTDEKSVKKILGDCCDNGDVAETRCEECGIFLCHFCSESHKRYRATKDHGLIPMEELKASAVPSSIAEKVKCAKHKEEVIKLYCITCQATICRDCTIVDHQGHKYGFIEDVALQEKEELQKNVNEVKQRKVRVQQGITSLKRFDEGLVAREKSVLAGINRHFDELAKIMEAKRRELVQKATALTSSKQKKIQAQREQLEMALASCESSIEFTEQAFKNGNDVQVLSMQKYILQSLEDLKRVKDQTQPCVAEDITFAVCRSAVDDMKKTLFNAHAVDDVVASPGNCKASFNEPDADLKIGKQSTIAIICSDKYNKRMKHGGQVIKPTISGVEVGDVTVNDNNDGSHTVCFSPCQAGVMKFEVTINGHPAPSCSLTQNVKWGFSNALGSGEITNNGLTMNGQGAEGTCCWRVGDCSFVSGVHSWNVRVDSTYHSNDQYDYGPYRDTRNLNRDTRFSRRSQKKSNKSYSCFEVGVIDSNEINEDVVNNRCRWAYDLKVTGSYTLSLVLDMENRELAVYSCDLDEELNVNQRNATAVFEITAERVHPLFALYHYTGVTTSISIIE